MIPLWISQHAAAPGRGSPLRLVPGRQDHAELHGATGSFRFAVKPKSQHPHWHVSGCCWLRTCLVGRLLRGTWQVPRLVPPACAPGPFQWPTPTQSRTLLPGPVTVVSRHRAGGCRSVKSGALVAVSGRALIADLCCCSVRIVQALYFQGTILPTRPGALLNSPRVHSAREVPHASSGSQWNPSNHAVEKLPVISLGIKSVPSLEQLTSFLITVPSRLGEATTRACACVGRVYVRVCTAAASLHANCR